MVAVVGVRWILLLAEAAFFEELVEVAWRYWWRLVRLGVGGFCAGEGGRFHFQRAVDLSLGEHSFSGTWIQRRRFAAVSGSTAGGEGEEVGEGEEARGASLGVQHPDA